MTLHKKKQSRKKKKKSILFFSINLGGIKLAQRVMFAKNMAVMVKAGMPITESLSVMAETMDGKFKKIILKITKSVKAGTSFGDSLKEFPKVFSPLFINSVQAGEASGTLEENLKYVAEQLRKENELKSKIKGAMLYPIIILIATFLLGMSLSFFVLPKITPLFEGLGVDLPVTTRFLIWFTKFIEKNAMSLVVSLTLFIMSFIWLVKQKFSKPVIDWVSLHTPIIKKLVKNSNITRFCQTFGTLTKSGLTANEAIRITSETSSNYYYQKALDDIATRLKSGFNLSANMQAYDKLFPVLVIRMIHVGEESGTLDDSLLYLASFYEDKVDATTKSLSTAIEPILLIGIGLIVGFLALSIITPIYSITGNIGT